MPEYFGDNWDWVSNSQYLHPTLEGDLKGHLQADVSVEHFVEHVWGLTNEHVATILDSKWTLDPIALQEYQNAVTEGENEEVLYPLFVSIATNLLSTTRATIIGYDTINPIEFIEVAGGRIMETEYGNRAPDGFTMWPGRITRRSIVQAIIEFKRKSTALPEDLKDSSEHLRNSDSDENHPEQDHGAGRAASASTHSESVSAGTGILKQVPTCAETTNPSLGASKKRKCSGSAGPIAKKRPRIADLTLDQLHLASHALECMADASRVYVTGIIIDKFRISLWYFDRIGVISTLEFSFDQSPEKLALVVFALGNCDPIRAGFDPFILQSQEAELSSTVGGIERPPTKMERPLTSFQGAELVIPASRLSSGDGSRTKGIRYRITDDRLYACRGLVGRGTTVYPVAELENGQSHSSNLVAKLSWPSAKRPTREDTFIAQIRKDVPYMQAHLPEVKFSATFSPEDLGLPRTRIPSSPSEPEIEQRVLTVMVTSRYQKLWEVNNIEEFQSVFVDFVECHHHVYEHAKVLHCDLSENNLMFFRPEDGTIRGILNDWDLASKVDDTGGVPPSVSNYFTGTLPYMAQDLVDENPPAHLYRHDLESFFYILVWAAVHYDLESHERRKTIPEMIHWEMGSQRNCNAKVSFLASLRRRDEIFTHIQKGMKGVETWLEELWCLFRCALFSIPGPDDKDYDFRTCGGHLTFRTFMAAIDRKPREYSTLAE